MGQAHFQEQSLGSMIKTLWESEFCLGSSFTHSWDDSPTSRLVSSDFHILREVAVHKHCGLALMVDFTAAWCVRFTVKVLSLRTELKLRAATKTKKPNNLSLGLLLEKSIYLTFNSKV